MWDTYRCSIQNIWVIEQNLINLSGRNVLASLDDEFLDPAGDIEKTVIVDLPEIAGS